MTGTARARLSKEQARQEVRVKGHIDCVIDRGGMMPWEGTTGVPAIAKPVLMSNFPVFLLKRY